MVFCYELSIGCCGCPVGHVVGISFVSYFVQGLYCCAFVFSNYCYPPYYFVDYVYGISGGGLVLISILGVFVANVRNMQPLRCAFAALVVLTVLVNVIFTYYYTIERWHDVMVTALTRFLRRPEERDFSDLMWYALTVTDCVMAPFFLVDLVYIASYLCNEWKSHLFNSTDLSGYGYASPFLPFIAVPNVQPSSAYPTNPGNPSAPGKPDQRA